MIINPVNVKPIFIMKSVENIQFNWLWKTKSSFWPHLPLVIFCFNLFHPRKEKVCCKSLSNIFMLISEFYFFQHGDKTCFYFCKYSFEKFWQTWHAQIRKRTSSKSFETFLEWFCFICLYFWDDWLLYTHFGWCLPEFSVSFCQTQQL